jgi:hypothetical protein
MIRKNITENFFTFDYQKFMKGCENPWEKAVDAIGSLEGKAAMIIG